MKTNEKRKKKKYFVETTWYCDVEVEAYSEEEAYELGECHPATDYPSLDEVRVSLITLPTVKEFVESEILTSDSWSLFGRVNLSLIRDKLRAEGFQRIPNDKRLKKIVREINDKHSDRVVGFY